MMANTGDKDALERATVNDETLSLVNKVKDKMPEMSRGQTLAAAGVATAAVATLAVARFLKRRGSTDEAAQGFRVEAEGEEGWKVVGEGVAEASFATKEEALSAARDLARSHAPSELEILRADGTVQDRHSYGTP